MQSEIKSGYFLNQIYRMRQLALYFAVICLLGFIYLDFQRFSGELLNTVLFYRTSFQLIPILLLIFLSYWQLCQAKYKQVLNALLSITVITVGAGHAEILVVAYENNSYFPKVGLVIILYYASIILALPFIYSVISSLVIILYASYSYTAAGLPQEEVLSITVFYLAFAACCLFMNIISTKMLVHNFKLIKQMDKFANTDNLTQLCNRRYFFENAAHVHKNTQCETKPFAILLVDLDHFKQINDAMGHDHGDQVLIQVARALQSCCQKQGDLLARFGGDEFVLLLCDTNHRHIKALCQKIIQQIETISAELNHCNPDIELGVSVGIAYQQTGEKHDIRALIKVADTALYHVKKNGKNGYQFADKSMFKDAEISSSQLSLA